MPFGWDGVSDSKLFVENCSFHFQSGLFFAIRSLWLLKVVTVGFLLGLSDRHMQIAQATLGGHQQELG